MFHKNLLMLLEFIRMFIVLCPSLPPLFYFPVLLTKYPSSNNSLPATDFLVFSCCFGPLHLVPVAYMSMGWVIYRITELPEATSLRNMASSIVSHCSSLQGRLFLGRTLNISTLFSQNGSQGCLLHPWIHCVREGLFLSRLTNKSLFCSKVTDWLHTPALSIPLSGVSVCFSTKLLRQY